MNPIILGWQSVLTSFVNQTYGRQYEVSDLDFDHNPYYTPVAGRKVIDVFPANGKHIHNGLLNIVPFDPVKFFANIPLVVYADDDSTGSQIIDILGESYGIMFDKSIDFDTTFLERLYQIDGTAREVTITFASTSMIWEGSFKVTTVTRGNNLAKEIVNRDLDALVIPDISTAGTQSLRLITTPFVVTNPTLVRKFSGSEPVVLENDILASLMEEIVLQRIVDASDAGELEDLFRGRTVSSHETGDEDFDRYMETVDVLQNGKWSGKPRFKFKSVEVETDIAEIVGDITVKDIIDYLYSPVVPFIVAAGDLTTDNMISELITAQSRLYPEKADLLDPIISLSRNPSDLFESAIKNIGPADCEKGYGEMFLVCKESSGYTGRLKLIYPLPTFGIEAEDGDLIVTEKSGDQISMESKSVTVAVPGGQLDTNNYSSYVRSSPLEISSMIAFMLWQSDADNMFTLKPDNIEEQVGEEWIYTRSDWPDIKVKSVDSE